MAYLYDAYTIPKLPFKMSDENHPIDKLQLFYIYIYIYIINIVLANPSLEVQEFHVE